MALQRLRRYRMSKPTIALVIEEGRHVARTIPEGDIVAIDATLPDSSKLVEVTWNEKTVLMFSQDVKNRGEKLD